MHGGALRTPPLHVHAGRGELLPTPSLRQPAGWRVHNAAQPHNPAGELVSRTADNLLKSVFRVSNDRAMRLQGLGPSRVCMHTDADTTYIMQKSLKTRVYETPPSPPPTPAGGGAI